MDLSIRAKILEILDDHRLMRLGTLRPDGWPQVTTVGYTNLGMTIYFMCRRDSQKVRNLAHDPRVSLTVDRDTPDPSAVTGVSMAAHAYELDSLAEVRHALIELMPKRFPQYQPVMQDVNLSECVCFRLEPMVISLLDYSKGFGHTDLLSVASSDLAA